MTTESTSATNAASPLGSASSEGLGLAPEREELRRTPAECEADGERAGRDGLTFDACPYLFIAAGVDQPTFEAHWRPRLNAWFNGWNRTRPPLPVAFNPRWHKKA